ncbi:hypothetical protein TELCIR_22938, partial [Teladorsagia circumcincta]
PSTVYRLRATVLINQVESSPSKLILLNTREAASKSPLIQAVKVLVNGSVFFEFLPAEDVDLVSNYTVEYRDVTSGETNWTHHDFESDASSRVLLTSLQPNRTYEAPQLPEVSLDPESEIVLDPDVLVPLEVRCDVTSTPPTKVFWLVN